MIKKKPDFIQENYSPVFNRLFYWYTVLLFYRRFQAVWVDSSGHPLAGNSALFIGNHNSWWDGLIPLLLNEEIYQLRGRAIMDEKQLLKRMFFRRLGVFSINRDHPRKAMKTLEYAARMINEAVPGEEVALFIYPEGKLTGPSKQITIESGLVWLSRHLNPSKCEIVPFATHIHSMRSHKPEMFIKIGNPIGPSIYQSGSMIIHATRTMEEIRKTCRQNSETFLENGRPLGRFRLLIGSKPQA